MFITHTGRGNPKCTKSEVFQSIIPFLWRRGNSIQTSEHIVLLKRHEPFFFEMTHYLLLFLLLLHKHGSVLSLGELCSFLRLLLQQQQVNHNLM